MVDQISPVMIGGYCRIYSTRRQHGYLQRYSACLGVEATRRELGAESGEEVTYDNEVWQACHSDATERGGLST